MSNFCEKCGSSLNEGAMFCAKCGNRIVNNNLNQETNINNNASFQNTNTFENNSNFVGYQNNTVKPDRNYQAYCLNVLYQKIKSEAIAWIIVASIQAITGLIYVLLGINLHMRFNIHNIGPTFVISGIIIVVISIINFMNVYCDFSYIKEIKYSPVGIIEKYKSSKNLIFVLLYNLIFGGLIGIVGVIFGFITRNFVINNLNTFAIIENNTKSNQEGNI